MTDLEVLCGSCGMKAVYHVDLDFRTASEDGLRARIVEKLGDDASYICPRCQTLVFAELGGRPIASPERLVRAQQAHRIGLKDRAVRFGVGSPSAARSSVWRVWMNQRRDDVYIAARSLGSVLKVSLHPNFWYFGFTGEYVKPGSPLLPPGADRKRKIWERPPEFAPGWTRAFEIIVPANEIVDASGPYDGSEAIWLPTPPYEHSVHFNVLLSKPDAERGRRGFPSADGFAQSTEFVTRLDLTTGERLWVLTHVAPTTENERRQIEEARVPLGHAGRDELLRRAREKPTFAPRALLFGHSADGQRFIIDLALNVPAEAEPLPMRDVG